MTSASLVALMLPIGSTIGAIVIGLLMDRYNPDVVLFCSYTLAACFILMLGFSTGSVALLVIAVFGAGIGTGGSQIGINALSAAFYPTASRATGVSWAKRDGPYRFRGWVDGGRAVALVWLGPRRGVQHGSRSRPRGRHRDLRGRSYGNAYDAREPAYQLGG
jgi:AAHS family 4-hydroxybenzoate transporter-like MFS transporter